MDALLAREVKAAPPRTAGLLGAAGGWRQRRPGSKAAVRRACRHAAILARQRRRRVRELWLGYQWGANELALVLDLVGRTTGARRLSRTTSNLTSRRSCFWITLSIVVGAFPPLPVHHADVVIHERENPSTNRRDGIEPRFECAPTLAQGWRRLSPPVQMSKQH